MRNQKIKQQNPNHLKVKQQNKAWGSFSCNYFLKEENKIAIMGYRDNAFEGCRGDSVRISVDTFKRENKQQQQKPQAQ